MSTAGDKCPNCSGQLIYTGHCMYYIWFRCEKCHHTETMAAVPASIMEHSYGQWSREEKLRLNSNLVCKDVFGKKCSLELSRRR